ncbi:MAG: PIN domain-containing protein [Acidobacteriota bacterium]|nr:PIN domain-containing protein [Acidobacteriota bacterium]
MTCLLDTGFLYAPLNRREQQHAAVLAVTRTLREPIVLPIPAITEVAYLLLRDVSSEAVADFIESFAISDMVLEAPQSSDYTRAAEIIRQYADAPVDFVDAIIVAIAEQLSITRILTIDRRHFYMFRPRHCPAFELLP